MKDKARENRCGTRREFDHPRSHPDDEWRIKTSLEWKQRKYNYYVCTYIRTYRTWHRKHGNLWECGRGRAGTGEGRERMEWREECEQGRQRRWCLPFPCCSCRLQPPLSSIHPLLLATPLCVLYPPGVFLTLLLPSIGFWDGILFLTCLCFIESCCDEVYCLYLQFMFLEAVKLFMRSSASISAYFYSMFHDCKTVWEFSYSPGSKLSCGAIENLVSDTLWWNGAPGHERLR